VVLTCLAFTTDKPLESRGVHNTVDNSGKTL
jgi:hypothetical protein